MNHAIIPLLLLALLTVGCEIHPVGTRAKLAALQKRAKYHGRHRTAAHHRNAAAQGMAIVSPEWLGEYHNLEAEHGDYTIPDDHRIRVEQNGAIKVPTTVIKHFNDLSKAPSTEPTP